MFHALLRQKTGYKKIFFRAGTVTGHGFERCRGTPKKNVEKNRGTFWWEKVGNGVIFVEHSWNISNHPQL